jgi:alkylation response protein AidB-like acyl-CoA dehydrogenase
MLHLQRRPPLIIFETSARLFRPQPATGRKLGTAIPAHRAWPHPGAKPMASLFYAAEHEAYREVMRRFVEKEIEPYAHEWDEAGGLPRVLYEKAAEIGLLGLGFPEAYGGTEVDNFMWIVAVQELARAGAGGVSASLKSNSIGAPPTRSIAIACASASTA